MGWAGLVVSWNIGSPRPALSLISTTYHDNLRSCHYSTVYEPAANCARSVFSTIQALLALSVSPTELCIHFVTIIVPELTDFACR